MTREEAKEILTHNWTRVDNPNYSESELDEAVDMAIEALSAVCDDCIWHVCNYNKIDWDGEDGYISRHDAVNEIHKYFVEEIDKTPTEIDEDGDELYADMPTVNSLLACNKELSKRIKALPSAEAVPIHEDGTLEVKVQQAQKVGRVLVMDTDSHIGGGLFYPESAEAVHKPDYSYEADMVRRLKEALSAEAVQVVRCKDCKHTYFKDFDKYCHRMVGAVKPNDFCSYGERKGGGDE